MTVSPSTRTYVNLATSTQTTNLDATSTQTTPYPTTGAPWVYKKVTFTVPSGTDVLSADDHLEERRRYRPEPVRSCG